MEELMRAMLTPKGILFYPLLVGLMGSVIFGVVGSYVVVRRISYIAGAIAHSALGGIGAALYCKHHFGWEWCKPQLGAFVAAIATAFLIRWVSLSTRQRVDSVITAIWVIGMAAGIIFMHSVPTAEANPHTYLFGDILLVKSTDFWLIGGLDLVVAAVGIIFYNKLLAVCFDDEFVRLRGVRADLYYLLLLILTALTIVLMMQIIGIVLMIGLLTLPPLTASLVARNLWQIMLYAVGICMVCVSSGLAVSYHLDLPSGAVIVIFSGLVYLLMMAGKTLYNRSRCNTKSPN